MPARVRVKASPETEHLDLAGREGLVYGWTTPSVSGVSVIGAHAEDFAVSIYFEALEQSYWISEELIEFVDSR